MKLVDILKLTDVCDWDVTTLTMDDMADIRPSSSTLIELCFMGEEETHITTYPDHPILIPFYNVECYSIEPKDAHLLEIWIDEQSFVDEVNKIVDEVIKND